LPNLVTHLVILNPVGRGVQFNIVWKIAIMLFLAAADAHTYVHMYVQMYIWMYVTCRSGGDELDIIFLSDVKVELVIIISAVSQKPT
jgi:hypothetical protein